MNGRPYSEEEIAVLKKQYPDTPTAEIAARLNRSLSSIYTRARMLGLKKSDAFLASPAACRLRRGDNPGIPYRFKPGHVPANKGLRRPGWYAGNMRATQFKKGEINGRAARLYKPIGTERVSKGGYLERKFTDERHGPYRWKAVHVLLWIEHYGPVPPGYAVGLIDGNKKNVVIENLVLLSRQDLMRRNSYHNNYPKEIGLLIQARGALVRQINKRTKHEKPRHRSA